MPYCVRLLLFCLGLFVLTAGGDKPAASADPEDGFSIKLYLLNKFHLASKEDKQFLRLLTKNVAEELKGILDDFSVLNLFFTKTDLNGDGVEEFIVLPGATTYFCGNSPTCQASVYTSSPTGWHYVGSIGTMDQDRVWGTTITVENNWSNGWRTTHNDEFRDCWIKVSDPLGRQEDVLGMAYAPEQQAGYFWSVSIDQKCPEELHAPRN